MEFQIPDLFHLSDKVPIDFTIVLQQNHYVSKQYHHFELLQVTDTHAVQPVPEESEEDWEEGEEGGGDAEHEAPDAGAVAAVPQGIQHENSAHKYFRFGEMAKKLTSY